MTPRHRDNRISKLTALLDRLSALHGELESAIQAKVDAIKAANLDALASATKQEQQTATTIAETELQRLELMDTLGRELGLPGGSGRTMSISQLQDRLDRPAADAIGRVAGELRTKIADAKRINRVAGRLCKDVIGHLSLVFDAIRPASMPPTGYAGDGRLVAPAADNVFELTG